MADFKFEIEEKLLVLSENEKGWTKELNRVSFNGAPATISELGVLTTARWARELPFPMKNFKFFWMHLKMDRRKVYPFLLSEK